MPGHIVPGEIHSMAMDIALGDSEVLGDSAMAITPDSMMVTTEVIGTDQG